MRRPAIAAVISGAILAGCGSSEKDERGLTVLPDMYDTPAAESQRAAVSEVDARDAQGNPIRRSVHHGTMLAPPEGTVPRGFQPYPLAAGDVAAARRNPNPLAPTPQVLKAGQRDYLSFCAPCHGRDGDAVNSYLAASFSGIPSLNGVGALQMPDGEVYHIVTMGRGRMANLRAQLPPERRWGVVHFLKLQARAAIAAEDVAKLVPYLDSEIEKRPEDAALRARRAELVRLAEQARADLAALGSAGDGREYQPPPAPVPEYVAPSWPVPQGPAGGHP